MNISARASTIQVHDFLTQFTFSESELFTSSASTKVEFFPLRTGETIPKFVNEFWTSKQRQASSIHEISYRACFKPQLPRFFINLFTQIGDLVYDPFSGRGTTAIEAALMGRNVIANDINPLSKILSEPRLFVPDVKVLKDRLSEIKINKNIQSEIDLTMFYHQDTLKEILSLRNYLIENENDKIDSWIRMLATNRLTGHSKGFFSVYTLPPNQAVLSDRQIKINEQRNQKPEYRNVKEIIFGKTLELIRDITKKDLVTLKNIGNNALFLSNDSRYTDEIPDESVQLTVTSPPFLDIVNYANDNWLRCWFNNIDAEEIARKITVSKKLDDWCNIMSDVFKQLFRITKQNGYVAFEVGEVRNGKVKLDEHIVEIGIENGFECLGIMINEQEFTKTANIWGVSNNSKGTNTNRIVIFRKG